MKRIRAFNSVILLLGFVAITPLLAGTISSVPSGGDWTATSTWVGGVVPGMNDDVIINGTVAAATVTVRSVTVNASATLTGMGGPQWLTVTSTFTNNGRVVLNSGNWNLTIYSQGTVINNGVWRPSGLEFKNNTQFTIGGTGSFEGGNILKTDSNATLSASTDLIIGCGLNLTGANWVWTKMNMQGHRLTLDGSTGAYRAGSILGVILDNVAGVEGRNGGFIENTLMQGTITLHGTVAMSPNVTLAGTIINEDTLTITGGPKSVYIKGRFTNNGVIVTHKDNWAFTLEVDGDIHNNGVWNPSATKITSDDDVVLSQTAGHPFEGDAFTLTDTVGHLIADSDLEFRATLASNAPAYAWGTLDMRGYRLIMDGRRGSYLAGHTDRMALLNVGDVEVRRAGALMNMSMTGTIHFYGTVIIGPSVSALGTVINHDTLRGAGGPNYFTVRGSFRNEGVVTWHPDRWHFEIDLHGDLTEAGTSTHMFYNIITDDQVRQITGPIRTRTAVNYNISTMKEGSVDVIGETRINEDLTVTPGSTLQITPSGTLRSNGNIFIEGGSTLRIRGLLVQERSIRNAAADLNLLTAFLRFASNTGIDSIAVACRSSSAPATFAGAVQRWWSIQPYPATAVASIQRLRLYLGDAPLNGNVASTIQFYHSDDNGVTWRQLTTDVSIQRDPGGTWVEMTDAPAYGDFLLSSRPDPISTKPGILVNIVGSDAIRIGAPNRLSIIATNVGPSPTEQTLLPIYTGTRIRILEGAEILPGGGRQVFTKNDLVNGGNDSTCMFVLASLQPGEQVRVDLIVTATAGTVTLRTGDHVQFEPTTMIVGGTIILWVGQKAVGYVVGKAIDYVGDKAAEGIALTPAEREKYAQALGVTSEQIRIRKTEHGYGTATVKFVGSEVTSQMLKAGVKMDVATALGENIAKKVAPSLRQRLFNWLYKETGLIKPDQPDASKPPYNPQVVGVTGKQCAAVTSRDPNEKNGITGIGTNGYLSKVVPLTYQIRFENVKDAQAAAYRIVIVDTLDAAVIDVATVRVVRQSHTGATFTQSGNILRWEWVGIDLPPNITPPEGEGFVEFDVQLRPGLPSGTVIRNSATITFDLNEPIRTNTWVNTLDYDPPVTSGLQVSVHSSDTVLCTFTASDGPGAGVDQTSIYVSQDNGVFFLGDALPTTGASMKVAIPAGTWPSLRFYALSTDAVGNIERTPTAIVSVTTDVRDINDHMVDVLVAPNPTEDMLVARTDERLPLGSYRVIDLNGRTILTGTASEELRLSVKSMAPGAYLLQTERGTVTFMKR